VFPLTGQLSSPARVRRRGDTLVAMAPHSYAYLASGRLHISRVGEPAQAFESAFAESVRQRHSDIQKRHSWKSAGRGSEWSGLLWGGKGAESEYLRVAITGVGRGPGGAGVVYVLDTGGLTAICALDATGSERRLLHGNERRLQQLSAADAQGRIACSVLHKDGSASIAVMAADATDLREVTEGDSLDQAPRWTPDGRCIVYQSAGVGRDPHGRPLGIAPFAVQELDLEQGETRTIAEDGGQDLLAPKVGAGGALYYIRRPHARLEGASFGRAMLDFVLFPARLLFALFQYLNFFTTRYTGRPLTTAGGPRRAGADLRQMMIWGNLIDTQRAGAEGDGEEPPAVVPRSWELVRQSGDGRADVLARSVVSFDLYPDGDIVYSTGSAIYFLSADGKRERACVASRVEQVVAL
jgi:hypothetical protein